MSQSSIVRIPLLAACKGRVYDEDLVGCKEFASASLHLHCPALCLATTTQEPAVDVFSLLSGATRHVAVKAPLFTFASQSAEQIRRLGFLRSLFCCFKQASFASKRLPGKRASPRRKRRRRRPGHPGPCQQGVFARPKIPEGFRV